MNFIYDISGANQGVSEDVVISKATKVKKGQVIKITEGRAVTDTKGAFIGVANESHTGEYDIFNPRNDQEVLSVTISPNAVYASDCPQITFTAAGTSTSAVFNSSLEYEATDLVGGYLIFISKLAFSTNTDAVGAVRKITDFNKAASKITISEGGIVSDGDVYGFIPPIGFSKLVLNNDYSSVALSNASGDFTVAGKDLTNRKVHVIIKNHMLK